MVFSSINKQNGQPIHQNGHSVHQKWLPNTRPVGRLEKGVRPCSTNSRAKRVKKFFNTVMILCTIFSFLEHHYLWFTATLLFSYSYARLVLGTNSLCFISTTASNFRQCLLEIFESEARPYQSFHVAKG